MAVIGVFKALRKRRRHESCQARATKIPGTKHPACGVFVSRSQVRANTCEAVVNDDAISRPQIGPERHLRRGTHLSTIPYQDFARKGQVSGILTVPWNSQVKVKGACRGSPRRPLLSVCKTEKLLAVCKTERLLSICKPKDCAQFVQPGFTPGACPEQGHLFRAEVVAEDKEGDKKANHEPERTGRCGVHHLPRKRDW